MTIQHHITVGENFHGRVIHQLHVKCKHKYTSKCMIKSRIFSYILVNHPNLYKHKFQFGQCHGSFSRAVSQSVSQQSVCQSGNESVPSYFESLGSISGQSKRDLWWMKDHQDMFSLHTKFSLHQVHAMDTQCSYFIHLLPTLENLRNWEHC